MKRLIPATIVSIVLSMGLCAAQGHTYAIQPQTMATVDTTSVLCLGNSFTYYFDTYNMLAEIAWSEGHTVKLKTSCEGGYTFGCHLAEPKSLRAIMTRGDGYDVVLLQNHSQVNAFYGRDPKRFADVKDDAKALVKEVRVYSPGARCFFESTWAYTKFNCGDFGTMEAFDEAMLKGTEKIAKKCKAEVSPIGNAFAVCRERHPEINLLYTDNHHPSKEGAYLKSCVNYLLIFGGNFSQNTSACTLDKDVAVKLQQVAYETVTTYNRR